MGDYRHRTTGDVKSQGEWRRHYANTSLPKVWNQNTLDSLMLDAVFDTPKPATGQYQIAVSNGVTQDAKGNWVQAWLVRDMFVDDEDGTKAEKEAAYQASLDATAAKAIREQRNKLLAETDWTQVNDAPVDTVAWATYRQALRDITNHVNFPYLQEADWPQKPQ